VRWCGWGLPTKPASISKTLRARDFGRHPIPSSSDDIIVYDKLRVISQLDSPMSCSKGKGAEVEGTLMVDADLMKVQHEPRGECCERDILKVNFWSESLSMFSLNLTPRKLRERYIARSIAAKLLDNVCHDLSQLH
jgi:hypothetical protein